MNNNKTQYTEEQLNGYACAEAMGEVDFIEAVCSGYFDDFTDEEYEEVLKRKKEEYNMWREVIP